MLCVKGLGRDENKCYLVTPAPLPVAMIPSVEAPGSCQFLKSQVSVCLPQARLWRFLHLVFLILGVSLFCSLRASEVWRVAIFEDAFSS